MFFWQTKNRFHYFQFFFKFFWNCEFVCITFAGAFEERYFKMKF